MTKHQEKKAYFYLLKKSCKNKMICEITEKYFDDNKSVCIFTGSKEDAVCLDSMLWSFKQTSFIPHDIVDSPESESAAPVKIIYDEIDTIHTDVLIIARHINKANILFLGKFHKIIDFAELWDDNLKLLSRERYSLLKDLGFSLETKDI